MPFFNQLDSQLIQKNQNFHISLFLLQIKTSSMKEQTNSTMNFVISEIFQLFYVQFIRNTRRSIGARLSCIKEILMADPAASGHPVMTLPPSYPQAAPFYFFLLVDGDGVSYACLIKVTVSGISLPGYP